MMVKVTRQSSNLMRSVFLINDRHEWVADLIAAEIPWKKEKEAQKGKLKCIRIPLILPWDL